MKKFKKLTLTLGIISIIFILLAFSASAADSSSTVIEGSTDNITYKIYTDAQVMIVSGEGKIPDHMFDRLKLACTVCYPDREFSADDYLDDYYEYTDLELELLKVKTVIIEEGITEIGHRAFDFRSNGADSISLRNVIFPNSLKKIGEQAFWCMRKLENINLPSNLKEIGEYAFAYTGLKNNLTIPESVTKIGEKAFFSCDSLKTIIFTNAVCPVGGCNSLEKIIYPIDYEKVPEVTGCNNLKQVIIPVTSSANTIKITQSLGYENFGNCPKLESITLSDKALEKFDSKNIDYAIISKKLPTKLDKVTNLKCTDNGDFTVSWSSVKNAGYYQLYHYEKNKWVKIYEGKNTTFTLSKYVKASGIYPWIKVDAVRDGFYGENKFTVRACAYDGKEYVRSSFVTVKTYRVSSAYIDNITAGKNKATLTLSAYPEDCLSGYRIYYRVKGAASYQKINVSTTKATISKLTSGKTYQFKVRAYYTSNGKTYYGAYSSVKNVIVK